MDCPYLIYHLQPVIDYQFNGYDYSKHVPFEYYELTRVLKSLGIFGFIMLLYKSNVFNWLFNLLRPVGQMAFTNYLTQSLFCGLYFNGVGFAMFGKLERKEVYLVMVIVWFIQIVWSNIWLRYFSFGPLEWCWRSLTYWKIQPIRKTN